MLQALKHRYKQRWLRSVYPLWRTLDAEERTIAEAAFDETWYSRWYPWYLVTALGGAWMFGQGLVMVALAAPARPQVALAALAVPIAVGLLVAADFVFMWLIRGWLQRSVWRGLRRRGINVCTGCGYFLHGVRHTTDVCPECGANRRPPTAPPTEPA